MDEHLHKFFIFQVKADFEPIVVHLKDGSKRRLYDRVEYAYMGCNCGAALRTRVKDGDKPTDA